MSIPSTLIVVVGAVIYMGFYFTYGRGLQKHVVKADSKRKTPSVKLTDGVDYVPANKYMLFGHHFASIAGAAPIVEPAQYDRSPISGDPGSPWFKILSVVWKQTAPNTFTDLNA